MKKYFYCKSYQSFLFAFSLIQKGEDVVIISPTPDVLTTCDKLKVPFISHYNFSVKEMINNPEQVKSEVKILIAKTQDGIFCFSHTQFAVFCFILIQSIYQNNGKIVFYDFEFVYKEVRKFFFSKLYLSALIYKKRISHIYNIELVLKSANSLYVLSINESFLFKRNIKVINNKDSFYDEVDFNLKKFKLDSVENYKTVYISSNISQINFDIKTRTKNVIKFIEENDISVKLHPNINDEDYFKNNVKVPSYFPVELLYNNISKAVISIHSAALITASKCSHLTSISLLDIVKNEQNEFANEIKQDLIAKSNGKILFPQNIKELESLIN